MLWDSLCNRWIYSNPSTIGYSGGMLLSGPRASTLGSETTLTCNYIAKSGGGDHLYDSCIIDDGTTVCVNATLKASGQVCGLMSNFSCMAIGTQTPKSTLHLSGENAFNVPLGDILLTRYYDNDSLVAGSSLFHFYNNNDSKEYLAFGVAGSGGTPAKPNQSCQIKMVIGANGNVGIGTNSPQSALSFASTSHIGIATVDGSDDGYLTMSGGGAVSDSRGASVYMSGNERPTYGGQLGLAAGNAGASGFINLITGGTERMRITSGGAVGINTCSPSATLHLNGCFKQQSLNFGIAQFTQTFTAGTPTCFSYGSYNQGMSDNIAGLLIVTINEPNTNISLNNAVWTGLVTNPRGTSTFVAGIYSHYGCCAASNISYLNVVNAASNHFAVLVCSASGAISLRANVTFIGGGGIN
jgi:hypothetical protein